VEKRNPIFLLRVCTSSQDAHELDELLEEQADYEQEQHEKKLYSAFGCMISSLEFSVWYLDARIPPFRCAWYCGLATEANTKPASRVPSP
jgi:hypothetical protein